MSKTIDERVVEMRFDNAQFERGVSQTMSSVEKLKRGLKMDGVSRGFGILDRSVNAVCSSFSALEVMGVTAIANITNSAVNAGKRIVKALTIDPVKSGFQEYETQINAVQTILANTSRYGTTLEQVNEALDELNHYADRTIYNFTEMTRNIGTFTAAGVDLDTSVAAIKGIANLAAVSGSTSQQASTAMYQLSQALAAGTVKLQDWNSVVNAGMGGQVFQDALKDTARVHGIAIDQMIADEGSFRETLQKGWLSSDILTESLQKFTGDLTKAQLLEKGYTEEQTRAILEMGQTANDAATKVKTFTQLIDTLKEAAQSGWTETWETIVGDFEEAKGLWTGISDRLNEMIGASASARNEMLSGGLASGWSRFLNEGITDAVAFKEAIAEAAEAHGVSISELVRNTASFEESLSGGWLNAEILGDALEALSAKTRGLSDEELAAQGITREQAEALEKLNQSAKDGTVDLKKYSEEMGRLSGRENLIASFWNTWNAFFADTEIQIGVLTAVNRAFRSIFPRTTSEQLYSFTDGLRKLTEKFKMSGETAQKLERSFKGIFAVLDVGKTLASDTVKAGFDLLSAVLGKTNLSVLDLTASAGDALTAFRDWVKENNIFSGTLKGLTGGLKTGVTLLREWIERLSSLPGVQERLAKFQTIFSGGMSVFGDYFAGGVQRISEFMDRVSALDGVHLDNLKSVLKDFKDNVLTYFLTMGGRFESFGDILETFAAGGKKTLENLDGAAELISGRIGGYFSGLLSILGKFLGKIVDVTVALRKEVRDNLGEILTVGMGVGFIVTLKNIGDALEKLAGPIEALTNIGNSFSDVLNSASKALNAFAKEAKSKAMLNVAKSVAILAASLAVLTLVPQENLWSSVAALGALAAGMVAVSAAMGAVSKLGDFKKISISFKGIASALLILVISLKKMEELDGGKVWNSLGILGALTAGLTAAAIAMSRAAPQLTQGALFLVAFAGSVRILAGALKSLEKLDISKAGTTIPLLAVAVTGLAVVASACGNLNMGSAAGILAVAAGLGILVSVFDKIAGMNMEGMKGSVTAFAAVFGTFAAIMAASHFAGANAAKAGVGILAMSGALLLLVPAIKGLGKIDPLDMERASDAVAKLLLVFGAVTAASLFAGDNAAKAGAMLLMMSGAMVVLTGVMTVLSHLDPAGLDRALAAVTQLELVFGALIAVTHFAGDVKGTLLTLTVTTSLLATALGALSLIPAENLKAASASLSLVMGAFSVVIAATHIAGKANAAIVVMTLAVGALGGILGALSAFHVEGALENAAALGTLLLSLSAAMVIAGKAGPISQNAAAAIAGMTLVTAAMAAILGTMSYLNVEGSLETAASLSLLLVSLSGACLILKGVGTAAGPALAGIGVLAALIASVGAVMAGLGALTTYFPQLEEFLDNGLGVLEKIGYGLGSFVGNIAGGFLEGTTAGLPGIGKNLSGFMENARPFFEGVRGIDKEAMAGVVSVAETILILSKADVINGLTSWLTGGKSLSRFGEELVSFGEAMAGYSDAVSGKIDAEAVTASANAAKTLAEFASAIPNSGGWLGAIMGENGLRAFGQELAAFGVYFAQYADSVKDIAPDTVTATAGAAKAVAEFASIAPNAGGLRGLIIGENTLGAFGKELKSFGPNFAAYVESVKNVTPAAVSASTTAAQAVAAFAKELPNSGGLAGLLAGNNDLDAFGVQLVSFGESFKTYAGAVSSIADLDQVRNATGGLRALVDVVKDAGDISGLRSFALFLKDLAQTRLDEFLGAFRGADRELREIGKTMGSALETGVRTGTAGLQNAGQDAGQGLINGLRKKFDAVYKAGWDLGKAAERGTRDALQTHSPGKAHMAAGEDAGDGTVLGLEKSVPKVAEAGKRVGEAALGGIKNLGSSAMNEVDKWLGKTSEVGKTAEETAAKETKAAEESAKAVQKSSKAKTKAVKSAYETFTEYIEEERYYNRLTTAEELEQYKKVQKAYRLSAEERKKVDREIYRLEKELQEETYQHSMDWIEEEKYYKRLSLEEELAAYERVQARHEQGTDEWKKMEREKFGVQNELQEEAYQNSLDWIEEEKYYKRLSLEEELAAWERVQARYLQGSEERKKADREVYRVRNELADKLYQDTLDWVDEQKGFDRMGLAEELAAYRKLQKQYVNDTEKRKKLDKSVYDLQKQLWQAQKDYYADVEKAQSDYHQKRLDMEEEYAEKVQSVNEQLQRDIQAANERYESAVESRAKSLYSSYGLFDEVGEKEDVDGSKLMANLEDQVKELSQWQEALRQLGERGVDKDLLAELEEMGPSAIAEIKALTKLSDGELAKYVSLWSIKHAQARKQAVSELEGLRAETDQEIAELQNSAARELEEYRRIWSTKMSQLESDTTKQMEDLKTNFEKTVGLLPEYTEQEFTEMVTAANEILRKGGWTELGEAIVDSLSQGVENKKIDFIDAMAGLAKAGAEAARTGNSFAMTHGKTLGYASNLISNALAEDVQPVVRPVLDLTDVEQGMGKLSNTFALSHTAQIQNTPRLGGNVTQMAADLQSAARAMNAGNDRVVGAIAGLRGDVAELSGQLGNMQMVLDTGVLVGEMSGPIDNALGHIATRRGRGI